MARDTFSDWDSLVAQIRAGDNAGLEQFYAMFKRGIRYYLAWKLGSQASQELDDRLHNTFLIVVKAIQKGDLREPERLMGFVHTIVRREVARYIERAIHARREADLDGAALWVPDRHENPEQEAMIRERARVVRDSLASLPARDRDVLVRFYLNEESEEQICREMSLTGTQFRLLKSRAKAKFGQAGRKKLAIVPGWMRARAA